MMNTRYMVFLKYHLGRIGIKHNTLCVYRRSVRKKMNPFKTGISVKIKKASKKDILNLFGKKDYVLARFELGDICFIAYAKSKPAGYLWLSLRQKSYMPEVEKTIHLKNRGTVTYDGHVYNEFRRKKFITRLFQEQIKFLRLKKIAYTYVFTSDSNKAIQRAAALQDFKKVREIKLTRIFWFKRQKDKRFA